MEMVNIAGSALEGHRAGRSEAGRFPLPSGIHRAENPNSGPSVAPIDMGEEVFAQCRFPATGGLQVVVFRYNVVFVNIPRGPWSSRGRVNLAGLCIAFNDRPR
jgi:hypothetical protein